MAKKRKTVLKDGPSPVDVHVGSRLKMRRHLLGISQTDLGDAVGLTFQQIQKYEKGSNRMGSSRLYEFTKILDVPISFFFDDMPTDLKHDGDLVAVEDDNELNRQETKELVKAYYRIPNPKVRAKLFETVKTIAKANG
jgi:transcriptional regulator with XRE-family HTH domain